LPGDNAKNAFVFSLTALSLGASTLGFIDLLFGRNKKVIDE
jgi:hypothetical protein